MFSERRVDMEHVTPTAVPNTVSHKQTTSRSDSHHQQADRKSVSGGNQSAKCTTVQVGGKRYIL